MQHLSVRANGTMRSSVRKAIEDQQLLLHYQPIVDLHDGRIVAAEALLRVRHPVYGIVPPAQFLPSIALHSDYRLLNLWVLRTAAREIREIQRRSAAYVLLSVNIAPQHIGDRSCVADFVEMVEAEDVDPSEVLLELTENAGLTDVELGIETLLALRKLGFRFAIDDFGTGFATLDSLATLPVDFIKLDRRFVTHFQSGKHSAIVEFVLRLAEQLGVQVVIEGIERRSELAFARDRNARYGQGYFFAPAVGIDDLRAIVKTRGTAPLL